MTETPGACNRLTDVAGLRVGHAADPNRRSGVTVLTAGAPFVAAVHVMGGAPGTVETDLLAPDRLVQRVDALVLSGGSAFGLAAADGVRRSLAARGRGFVAGGHRVPIVPGAILFDLGETNDGGADYAALGRAAFADAGPRVAEGSVGAGTGARTADLKGGLGTASIRVGPFTLGALVAVNARGSAIAQPGPNFWAGAFEIGAEFGGLGPAPYRPSIALPKADTAPATTLAIMATDAALTQAQATRLAVTAHDGLARALEPAHTLLDGDCVFAAATSTVPLSDPAGDQAALGAAAARCLARAIARGVFHASRAPGDPLPTWQEAYGTR